jgi:hypothetical protein
LRRPLPTRSTKPETECNLARFDAMVEACLNSRDYVEGRRAFMEKRKPNFRGKSLPVVNYLWSLNTPQPGNET